ncbi:MAG: glucosamine-6-phosphate deaminase [Bacilli bacterium]
MKVIIVENYEEMSEVACEIIAEQIKEKPNSIIGLATGSSPVRTYELLIEEYQKKEISFKDVTTFNLDEYIGLDYDHPQSYHYFMNDVLFSKIDIDLNNTNFPDTIGDLDVNVAAYNKKLYENQIDLQLLGIGSNGHIAFNEPGTSFDSETHVVELTKETKEDNKRFFNSIEEVPTTALTMGIKSIMNAKKILILASGLNKAQAIKELLEGIETTDLPASILMSHPEVILVCDEASASLLEDVEEAVE